MIRAIVVCMFVFARMAVGTTHEAELILSQPESAIDVGRACLILAREAYPDVDIDKGIALFDAMAGDAQEIAQRLGDPLTIAQRRIRALDILLFTPGPWNRIDSATSFFFQYDPAIGASTDQSALFLPYLIQKRRGTYPLMAILWYIVADRLKWPVAVMRLPFQQMAIKYTDRESINIDVAHRDRYLPDSAYITAAALSKNAVKKGIYLRKLSRKEFLASLLVNSAFYCASVRADTVSARTYFELALKHDSRNAEALAGLGVLTGNRALVRKARAMGMVLEGPGGSSP